MVETTKLVTFGRPSVPVQLALHRRGKHWYTVFPRAYGMAQGWKLVNALNEPRPSDSALPPKNGESTPNMRFWLREQPGPGGGLQDLLAMDVPIIKDTGLRRTVHVRCKGLSEDVVESLVEVLLREDQLSHRCGYCGSWEYCYDDSPRMQRVGGSDEFPLYWCGECSQAAAIFKLKSVWWRAPEHLSDGDYFFYRLV